MPLQYVGECQRQKGDDEDDEDSTTEVDVLLWWSRRSEQFPILSIMAKEFLSVSTSTVAIEQAFSSGGYILDERRSTILAANLEAQILLKDWSLAEQRKQEPNWRSLIEECEEDDSELTTTNASSE